MMKSTFAVACLLAASSTTTLAHKYQTHEKGFRGHRRHLAEDPKSDTKLENNAWNDYWAAKDAEPRGIGAGLS